MNKGKKLKGEELEKYMVDKLAKEMLEWVYKLDDKPAITSQFFSRYRIPWHKFVRLKEKYPNLDSAYQEVCTELCMKWFNYGLKHEKLSFHKQKMLEKYLHLYDPHIWEMKNQNYQEMKVKKTTDSIIQRIIPKF